VRPWRQAPTRQGRRLAGPAARDQRLDHVDHGQARADDDDVVGGGDPVQRSGRPGIADDPASDRVRRVRRRIAGAQDDSVGLDLATVRQGQAVGRDGGHARDAALDQTRMRGLDRGQLGADIVAIELARGEVGGIRQFGPVDLQPVGEIVGPALDRGHPVGPDVEQMPLERGRIGDARAEVGRDVDQHGGDPALGQPGGQHGAGEAAADDRHSLELLSHDRSALCAGSGPGRGIGQTRQIS
jgi:hypothetical protein